jgi:hypothetical protein
MLEIEQLRQLKVQKDGTRWTLMEGATLRLVAFEPAEAVELLMACRLAVRHADYNDRVLRNLEPHLPRDRLQAGRGFPRVLVPASELVVPGGSS